jgi:putative ABC transport system ATP-binding protein
MIRLRGVRKSYSNAGETVNVLDDVRLDVAAGDTVALVGDSGCGKTTLLHLLAGFDSPDAGTIEIAGSDITGLDDAALSAYRRRQLGMVFQQFNLVSPLTVEQNLRFPQRLLGRRDEAWCRELCERLGLQDLLARYPDQLSGGQQQRVAVARALVHRPPLLLADEPTGNLDESNSARVMALLRELVTETGTTLVLVTHSAEMAAMMRRRLHLQHGRLHEL